MSLEAAIQENTSVLRELLARLSGAVITPPTVPAAKEVEVPKPAPTPAAAAALPTPPASAAPAAAAASPSDVVAYDQVSKAITDGVKADRAKVVAVLAEFGVKKGTELKPEQYAEFLAALSAKPVV